MLLNYLFIFQEVYDKIDISQKVTYLVTALRSADNAIEV
jgi:hypothetical protein